MSDLHKHHEDHVHTGGGHDDHDHDHGQSVHAAHDHGHEGHGHGHHDHSHELRSVSQTRLKWALVINLVFLAVEAGGGIITHSLALLADAGHMLTDVAALVLALIVARLAMRPATPERTFGLLRAEVLGAFFNGATLVLIVGLIMREAWLRLGTPETVDGPLMLIIAFVGLLANLGSAFVLAGGREANVNVQGAFMHMVADAMGSVGAMIAGAVIWTTGWNPIDPLASALIGVLILWSTWGLLKGTLNILLEATPENIKYEEVKAALEDMEHIEEVHDLHIWTITSGVPVLSAHLSLSACCCDQNHWQECMNKATELLKSRFGITHSTLQVETADAACEGECQLIEESNNNR